MIKIIEKILCFLIAASLVIQLAPNESYKKCMKFFSGIVLLIFVLTCVFDGLSAVDTGLQGIFDLESGIWKDNESYYESIFNEHYGNVTENEDDK